MLGFLAIIALHRDAMVARVCEGFCKHSKLEAVCLSASELDVVAIPT